MAIPSQQIGWSQKAKLLWQISKQLEKLTQVAGNVYIPQCSTSWTFNSGANLSWPADQTGYTLYEGGWSAYDDGNATDPVDYGGTFKTDGIEDTQFYLSTNGYIYGVNNSTYLNGNGQDLYLTPGDPLDDGDTQNFWYQNTVDGSKWKTSILVYCGHCCGSPQQQTPYSYILNIYRDANYQYLETRAKTNGGGTAGAGGPTQEEDVTSQVWQSDLDGLDWTYLGYGTIS
jgi:hypothetical protein